MSIDIASAKVRSGAPGDAEQDYTLPVWAGVLPISFQYGDPIPDADLFAGVEFPGYLQKLIATED
jgi:hypothetical protein